MIEPANSSFRHGVVVVSSARDCGPVGSAMNSRADFQGSDLIPRGDGPSSAACGARLWPRILSRRKPALEPCAIAPRPIAWSDGGGEGHPVTRSAR